MADGPDFVDLGDFHDVADEEWFASQRLEASTNGSAPQTTSALIRTLGAFRSVEEPTSEALLGTSDDSILPADGILLMYGDGGAGKTTLTLDAVSHLADGRGWLGLEVGRPVRSLIIENEGPRGMFRRTVNAKFDESANDAVHVLEEPWSRFTIADSGLRRDVADYVNEALIDLVVLGPLATVGMVGGGTPDEISAFEKLLRALRGEISRPVAFWIVHHENKAGDVSGAWERVPDTLIHVQAAGNGHTRFVFRKARWSSENHGKTLALVWEDGRTFSIVEDVPRDLYAEMLEAFRESDEWRTYREAAKLVTCRPGEAKSVLAELTRRGDLMFEVGPVGRSSRAQCWRLRGATILSLVPEPTPPDDGFAF